MKVHVNSFGLDMNAMLNQLNSKNGLSNADAIYKKAMHDVQPKFAAASQALQQVHDNLYNLTTATSSKNLKYVNLQIKGAKNESEQARQAQEQRLLNRIKIAHDDLTGFVNGKHSDSVQQLNKDYKDLFNHIQYNGQTIKNANDMINAVKSDEKQAHADIKSQIDASNQFTQEVVNNTMPKYVQQQMQAVRNSFPTNMVDYYPVGQFPSSASPGDICWQSGDFNSNTDINARAYRYNGSQWVPLKVDTDIFGDNIFGADIHGGTIYGANFVSEDHGMDGKSNFSVDPYGDIYARNFSMDLQNQATGNAVNRMSYNTMGDNTKGLNFNGGTLHMTASAYQDTGTYIKDYQGNYYAATYLEPDYLKLRSGTEPPDSDYGTLIGRTDLRGGNLELSDQWNQNWGIRLGYWNDSGGNEGPLLSFANGNITLGYPSSNDNKAMFSLDDWNYHESGAGKLWIEPNDSHAAEIELNAPVNIDGTLFVQNSPIVKSDDYENDLNQINNGFDQKQQELDKHNQWLANHQQILTTGGTTLSGDSTRLDQHDSELSDHANTLQDHTNHLNTHDTEITSLQQQADQAGNTLDSYSNDFARMDANQNIFDTLGNLQSALASFFITPDDMNITVSGHTITSSATNWVSFGGDGNWEYVDCADLHRKSALSIKKDIASVNPQAALTQILGTDIKSWHYKNERSSDQKHIGPIIDNVHPNTNLSYYTPNKLITHNTDGDAISVGDTVSYLILSVQELEKQNSQLTQRVAKLEFNQRK